MKIRPVGAELFHADGRIDMTKLVVAFRNFANAPKNETSKISKYERVLKILYVPHGKMSDLQAQRAEFPS
jgi:hypothetical protein